VVRKVGQAVPREVKRELRRRHAELHQLAHEARVPHLGFEVVLLLAPEKEAILGREFLAQRPAHVGERRADDRRHARVLRQELQRRPGAGEEGPRQAPLGLLRRQPLAELHRDGVRAVAVVARGQVLANELPDGVLDRRRRIVLVVGGRRRRRQGRRVRRAVVVLVAVVAAALP